MKNIQIAYDSKQIKLNKNNKQIDVYAYKLDIWRRTKVNQSNLIAFMGDSDINQWIKHDFIRYESYDS